MVAGFIWAPLCHVRRSFNEAVRILAITCNSLGFISDFSLDCIRKILCIDVI
jgi:hypothetical protein